MRRRKSQRKQQLWKKLTVKAQLLLKPCLGSFRVNPLYFENTILLRRLDEEPSNFDFSGNIYYTVLQYLYMKFPPEWNKAFVLGCHYMHYFNLGILVPGTRCEDSGRKSAFE